MSVVVKIDTTQLQALAAMYDELGEKGMFQPLKRALNRTGDRAYTQIVRTIAKETGAQQKRVREVIRKIPASVVLVWKAVARDRSMSLKDFKPRQTGGGVKHSAWGGGVIPHAFIVPSLGGHVFMRQGAPRVMAKGRYKGRRRQPLEKLWGPAIPVQLVRGKTTELLQKMADEVFIPEALRQADREIEAIARKHRLVASKFAGGLERLSSFIE